METRGSTSAAFPETPLLYLIPLPLKTLCSNTHKPNTHTHNSGNPAATGSDVEKLKV